MTKPALTRRQIIATAAALPVAASIPAPAADSPALGLMLHI